MKCVFQGKRITGMLGILPENEYDFDEETKHFASTQTKHMKKVMGFGKRRAAKEDSVVSDFLITGTSYLLEKGYLKKEEIGAVIVVTLTPDYYLPQISSMIHGECGLNKEVVCMDIAQGCSGFMVGLMQAFMLLNTMKDKKVLVMTGDVLNRKKEDRQEISAQFGGDAASITVVENDNNAKDIYFNMYNDGSRRGALVIPAGGYKLPRSLQTSELVDSGNGTLLSKNDVWMDGTAVFNFAQREVPPLIEEILEYADKKKESIDWFFFHQPNKFMLQKLADKMKVPREKMPMDTVGKYGNSSGSTIPVTIVDHAADQMTRKEFDCCLCGFGSGLTWCSAVMKLGLLDFCEMMIAKY